MTDNNKAADILAFTGYLRTVTLAALILAAATAAVKLFMLRDTATLSLYGALAIVLFYYLTGIGSGYLVTRAASRQGSAFVTGFMLAGAGKLLLYFAALLLFLYLDRAAAAEIIVLFAACYIVFAVAERTFVMKTVRGRPG